MDDNDLALEWCENQVLEAALADRNTATWSNTVI